MKTRLCATVIALASSFALGQQYKVLWSFAGLPNDGADPVSGLVSDGAGNLYGTTQYGGANDGGTVFELSPNTDGSWEETVLYNFCSNYNNRLCLDGQYPVAGLIFDQAGNLYGTTNNGGSTDCLHNSFGCGTVFELSPSAGAWTETVLYSFCADTNCDDGYYSGSQLIFDGSGNLYSTTSSGGTGNGSYGTVFELSPSASGWTLATLYDFCMNGHARICPDGAMPEAGLTFDKSGNLYGTTLSGGTKDSQGAGTVYELSPDGNGWMHTTLLAFNPDDGSLVGPLATVSFDPQGNLYSTADSNGVFELQAKTRKERKFVFNIKDGSGPTSGVLLDPATKAVYGTTSGGGSNMGGVVYKIGQSGQETVLYNFCQQTNCADGQYPYAGLIEDKTGNFYGTTEKGGAYGYGVIFEIVQSNQ
jgi:uncharacterized repeat protein (TIGR03803 family)